MLLSLGLAAFIAFLVAAATTGAIVSQRRETEAAELKISEAKREAARANERAATLERDAAALQVNLMHERMQRIGRALSPAQIEVLRSLKGKVKELTVVWSRGTEPSNFGREIGTALMFAGINVRMPQVFDDKVRDKNLMDGSVGISVYEPSDAPQPRDLLAGPVAKAFASAGFNPGGSARPDFAKAWPDEPIVMVGGKQYEMLPGLTR